MKKLVKYFKPYIWQILILVIFTYIQVMANLRLPDYMAKIVNEGIISKDNSVIYNNGLMMLLVTLAGDACAIIVGFLAAKIATGFAKDIRKKNRLPRNANRNSKPPYYKSFRICSISIGIIC